MTMVGLALRLTPTTLAECCVAEGEEELRSRPHGLSEDGELDALDYVGLVTCLP